MTVDPDRTGPSGATPPDPAHRAPVDLPREVPDLAAGRPGTLDERMGIEVVRAGPDGVVLRMPVAGNIQPFGLLHGGANAVLVESAGSIAANLHAGPGRAAVGVDLSVTHHRSVRSGTVTAVATPLSAGRTVATYDVAVTDDDGRRVATGRLTCLLRDLPG